MLCYFDYAATTPVHPRVAERMMGALTGEFGNPSSVYAFGRAAAASLKADRAAVAGALGCDPREVYFTSGGTEGDNWAIRGGAELNRRRGKHIVTTAVEHAAVLETCRELERRGYEVTCLKPDRSGHIRLEQLRAALRPDTALVSMMLVNNELGTLLPVAEAVKVVKGYDKGILFHCDGVQGFLKVPGSMASLGADLVSVSAHKIGGPKGIGALYIRQGVRLPPLLTGGGQEGGLRSGTEATAQIAGFAEACRVGLEGLEERLERTARNKKRALELLREAVPALEVISEGDVGHICALTLPGYKSEVLVRVLGDQGICLSSGSACHRGKPSHVFAALGLPKAKLDGALRLSFSADTTEEELERLAAALKGAADSLFTTLS